MYIATVFKRSMRFGLFSKDLAQILKKYNPVNLNLGAPDFLPPTFVRSAMWNVTVSDDPAVNQYSAADVSAVTESELGVMNN